MGRAEAGGPRGARHQPRPVPREGGRAHRPVDREAGTLPPVSQKIRIKATLLDRVLGAQREIKVEKIRTSEMLAITVGTTVASGKVTSARGDEVELALNRAVTVFPGSRVAISRRLNAWRLIGFGIVEAPGK